MMAAAVTRTASGEKPPPFVDKVNDGAGGGEAWNAAFSKFSRAGWSDGEDGRTAMLDAYALREALGQVNIAMTDGEVVCLLESMGKHGVRGRLDFAQFVEVCRSRVDLLEQRQQRKVEVLAAFEAMGGGAEVDKVDAQRIKDVLESFEMLEVRDKLVGGDQVTLASFSEFLKSANEDIDLDTNLHSTGESWLRRDASDVKFSMVNGKVNVRQQSGHAAAKGPHKSYANVDVDEQGQQGGGKGEDWHRLEWLESLQQAWTAKDKAEQAGRKAKHRLANTIAARGGSKRFGQLHAGEEDNADDDSPQNKTAPARLGGHGVKGEKSVEFGRGGLRGSATGSKTKNHWKV